MKKFLCLLAIALPMLLSGCSNGEAVTTPEIEYPMSSGGIWLPEDGSLSEEIYFSHNFIYYKTYNEKGEYTGDSGLRSCKYTYSHPHIWMNRSEGLFGDEKYVKEGEFLKGIEEITVDSSKLTIKMFSGEVRVFVSKYRR